MTRFDSTRFDSAGPIFKVTCHRAKQSLGADIFVVMIPDLERLEFDLHIEDEGGYVDSSRIYYDLKGIDPDGWNQLLSISKTVILGNEADGRFMARLMNILGAVNIIICPLSAENLGSVFSIWGWKSPKELTEADTKMADLIGEQIALSLSASMSERKSREQGEKLAALLELSTSIYSSLNYKDVLSKAVKLSMEIVGADGGTIFIIDKEENVLVPLLTVDELHEEAINSIRLKPGQGLTGWVAETGVGLISNHSENDPRSIQVPGTPIEPESLICAPLTWSGEIIGVITLRNNTGKQFALEDLEILTIFARQTSDAIENAKLYEELEKAYEELSAAQQRLIFAEKLKALGEMAGGVAHDFNNILATVIGRVQLLLTKIESAEIIKDLKIIEEAALAGSRTVRRLQDFTHVSTKSQYADIDLNGVAADAIEYTAPSWKSTALKMGITIRMNQNLNSVSRIEGNYGELKEAVCNVILNSVDALHKDGNIWVETGVSDGKVFLRIADDGIGMDEETKSKLFYPFFSTKRGKGSGMGLAVVYGIMFRHQAEISVESSPGKGAEFLFRFIPAAETEKKMTTHLAEEEISSLKILLVDDDANLLSVVADMIDHIGHTCTMAGGGRKAMEALEQEKFDLVITDLGMPEFSGWDVARFCRAKYPGIPVLLISGWGAQIDRDEALQKVDAVLPKPFQLAEFEKAIKTVINQNRQKHPVC